MNVAPLSVVPRNTKSVEEVLDCVKGLKPVQVVCFVMCEDGVQTIHSNIDSVTMTIGAMQRAIHMLHEGS